MQLPLTGVFNRLTLSVCRATIDTQVSHIPCAPIPFIMGFVTNPEQSLSRVSAFEWDSSALQQRLAAPSKPLPPVVLVCSRVLQVRHNVLVCQLFAGQLKPVHYSCQSVTPSLRQYHGSSCLPTGLSVVPCHTCTV